MNHLRNWYQQVLSVSKNQGKRDTLLKAVNTYITMVVSVTENWQ